MKTPAVTYLATALLFSLGCTPTNYDIGPPQAQASNVDPHASFVPKIVLAELFAKDPLRHNYDFVRSDYGAIIQNGTLYNAGSHLDYSSYSANEFTVAIQGGNQGLIVDLGSDDEVAASLGVAQTGGGGQGFAGLVLHADGHFGLPAADAVLDRPKSDVKYEAHAPPKKAHVFLIRIVDSYDAQLDLVVKLFVVSLTDGDRVAFEWMRLR